MSEQGIIQRLRSEQFNVTIEERLTSHEYLEKAESGELTLAQRRAFACEECALQQSVIVTFAYLAGAGSASASASGSGVGGGTSADLFRTLHDGEVEASKLLTLHATSLGLTADDLSRYKPQARAQAHPSFLARLALSGQRAATAAACAVNFPGFGRLCGRLAAAYRASGAECDVQYLDFFASPLELFDEMANQVIQDENVEYAELARAVRLIQEYEVMFWDSLLDAIDT